MHAGYGYTHLVSRRRRIRFKARDGLRSASSSRYLPPGELRARTACVVRAQHGVEGLSSRPTWPRSSSAAYIDPLLDVLLDEADEFVPAWEWDLWNRTAARWQITIMRHVGTTLRTAPASRAAGLHFGPHTTSWFCRWRSWRGRFGFWDDLAGDVDGINYQTVPDWTTQELQDRMVDISSGSSARTATRYKFRMWEDQATKQLLGAPRGADDGDARGYYWRCARTTT